VIAVVFAISFLTILVISKLLGGIKNDQYVTDYIKEIAIKREAILKQEPAYIMMEDKDKEENDKTRK